MKKYVIALDEGTTSARTLIFDADGNIVAVSQREFTQYYPKPGWVEQDAVEIFSCQYSTLTDAVFKAGIDPSEVAAVGITNQRETTVVWEKATGKPVYRAIVWQCKRTADMIEDIKREGHSDYIKETTGLVPDAYFSATKLKWILDNVQGAREKAENGELLFGTVDTWLIWKLTGGKVHATDLSNASRTMLFDIKKLCWDEKLLSVFDIPESMLPEVRYSSDDFGTLNLLGAEIPICGCAGDQQAALFGQCCFEKGDLKNTYGTGCFLLMNAGDKPCAGDSGLIDTIAATPAGAHVSYALEGSVFVGGAVIQWLRDELGFIREAKDSEYFASKIDDCGGVYVVPAFAGLGAPYWDMYAKGVIVGLTRGSGRNHIIRAALESIAYQTNDLLLSMGTCGIAPRKLRVDGGASANDLLMRFQADISNIEVIRGTSGEATARGAAFLAGLYCGIWKDREQLTELNKIDKIFIPDMPVLLRREKLDGWKRAVECARLNG